MDKSLFNNFIYSNANKIYFYVYCIVKNHEQTLAIVALCLEECWNNRKNIQSGDLTYVFKVARKLSINKSAIKNHLSEDNIDSKILDDKFKMNLVQFCSYTNDLSPIQTHVICLRSIVGLRIEEISIVLELGLNNVNSILADVRKHIRSCINNNSIIDEFDSHELLLKYYSGNTSIEEEEQLKFVLSKKENIEISDTDQKIIKLLQIKRTELPICCETYLKNWLDRIQNSKNRKSIFSIFKKK